MIPFGLKYEKAYRQGEILIFKVKRLPMAPGRKVPSGVIRVGEKEGHEHKVTGKYATLSLFPDDESGTLKVEKTATITHPEHKPIKLPKGNYVVGVQKEATGRNRSASVKD